MNQITFKEACMNHGISIEDKQIEQLKRYMELLLEWNEKMNLTAITDPDEIWE